MPFFLQLFPIHEWLFPPVLAVTLICFMQSPNLLEMASDSSGNGVMQTADGSWKGRQKIHACQCYKKVLVHSKTGRIDKPRGIVNKIIDVTESGGAFLSGSEGKGPYGPSWDLKS